MKIRAHKSVTALSSGGKHLLLSTVNVITDF